MTWRQWRDRWLGDPAIRDRIARLPLGGRIAGHHARRLFATATGFASAQMLAAAVELGVFDALRDGPRPWAGLVDLPPAGADALGQALVAAGLIESRGAAVALTVDGLVVATDAGLRAMIAHNRLLYADLADPVAALRGRGPGAVAAFWPYRGGGNATGYSALMAASNAMVADALIGHPIFARARHVMDVGGGDGTFARALHRRWPAMRLSMVDLPAVVAGIDLSGDGIAAHGIAPDAPLPPGADTITLVRLLHDQDDAPARILLRRVAAALPPGGHVVVAEPMALPKRDPQTAYFAAYFAAMRSGRLRSAGEVRALLSDTGFTATTDEAAPPLARIVTGQRPSNSIDAT